MTLAANSTVALLTFYTVVVALTGTALSVVVGAVAAHKMTKMHSGRFDIGAIDMFNVWTTADANSTSSNEICSTGTESVRDAMTRLMARMLGIFSSPSGSVSKEIDLELGECVVITVINDGENVQGSNNIEFRSNLVAMTTATTTTMTTAPMPTLHELSKHYVSASTSIDGEANEDAAMSKDREETETEKHEADREVDVDCQDDKYGVESDVDSCYDGEHDSEHTPMAELEDSDGIEEDDWLGSDDDEDTDLGSGDDTGAGAACEADDCYGANDRFNAELGPEIQACDDDFNGACREARALALEGLAIQDLDVAGVLQEAENERFRVMSELKQQCKQSSDAPAYLCLVYDSVDAPVRLLDAKSVSAAQPSVDEIASTLVGDTVSECQYDLSCQDLMHFIDTANNAKIEIDTIVNINTKIKIDTAANSDVDVDEDVAKCQQAFDRARAEAAKVIAESLTIEQMRANNAVFMAELALMQSQCRQARRDYADMVALSSNKLASLRAADTRRLEH